MLLWQEKSIPYCYFLDTILLLFGYHTATFWIPYCYFLDTILLLFGYHTATFILTEVAVHVILLKTLEGDFMGSTDIVKIKKTTMLQKPSGTIAISGNLDARERKLYNMLLKVAEINLRQNPQQNIFTTTLATLKQALNVNEDDKHNTDYKKILEKMSDIKLRYNILKKDHRIEGFAHLIDNVKFITDESTKFTTISYSIPEEVRQSIINKNGMYASIDLVIIRGLVSKYSIILYELVKDYQKVEIPKMTMQDFKEIFGIEGKYEGRINNLKAKVLDVAVNELNANENINFTVKYELIKTGKIYTHIKFTAKPKQIKEKQIEIQELQQLQLQPLQQLPEKVSNPELEEIIPYLPRAYQSTKKVIDILIEALEHKRKSKDYIISQIKYCNEQYKKDKVKNYVLYLRNAIEKDYACAEEVELDIVRPEDAEGYIDERHPKDGMIVRTKLTNIHKFEDGYLVTLVDVDRNFPDLVAKVSPEWLLERARKHKENKTR